MAACPRMLLRALLAGALFGAAQSKCPSSGKASAGFAERTDSSSPAGSDEEQDCTSESTSYPNVFELLLMMFGVAVVLVCMALCWVEYRNDRRYKLWWEDFRRRAREEEEESLDHDELARRVFSDAAKDGSGTLAGNELVEVLKKLIRAANLKVMSRGELEREALECLNRFGAPFGSAAAQGVTLDGFKAYAASKPELFGPLHKWREFFNNYASVDAQGNLEIQLEDCEKLVIDVCSFNGNAMSAAGAKAEAEALMEAADADHSGSINFGEFVSYARGKEELFGKIAQHIMSPYMSPRKDRGQATSSMDIESVNFAEKLFKDADKDGNGTLDQNELGKVLREMVKAAGLRVTGGQVNDELGKCLIQFGDGSTVALQGFLKYAASRPEWFGPLFQWREFFNKYACPRSGEMQLEQAQKFMKDVFLSNGRPISEAAAAEEARKMMGAADGNGDGSVSFAEFVTYAKQNLALFGKSARPHAESLPAASLLLRSPDF